MRRISPTPFCAVALVLCIVGCAHQQPEPAYSSLPALTPTSDGSADRVYTTTITAPGGAQGSITQGSRGEDGDTDIADRVRKTVLSDPKLAPYPSKVTATMDANSKGKVILTGKVPTRRVQTNLVEHVRQLPGVTEVEDRLVLDIPHLSREADPQAPKD